MGWPLLPISQVPSGGQVIYPRDMAESESTFQSSYGLSFLWFIRDADCSACAPWSHDTQDNSVSSRCQWYWMTDCTWPRVPAPQCLIIRKLSRRALSVWLGQPGRQPEDILKEKNKCWLTRGKLEVRSFWYHALYKMDFSKNLHHLKAHIFRKLPSLRILLHCRVYL